MDDNERFYLGKTLLNQDIIVTIEDIIINILQEFNLNGAHNDSCTIDSNQSCGINADRIDDRHYNDFIELIDPEDQVDNFKEIDENRVWTWESDFKNKDTPYTNQDKIRNSLQQGRVETNSGKLILNDVLLDLDTSDIILYSDPEINDPLNNVFFNNKKSLTNIIYTMLDNLWEIRSDSLHIRYDDDLYPDEKIGICLDMFSPYNGETKTSTTELPPRTSIHSGLMLPSDLDSISSINNKVDKVLGKGLSQNDFTNDYLANLNTVYQNYLNQQFSVRHLLITEEIYNNDEAMIIPWDELTQQQKDNLPPDIMALPENERYYDPRDDAYNMYWFVDEIPSSYIPPTFDSSSPIEFGVGEHNGESWLYYKNIQSSENFYFLKVSELLTESSLENLLTKNLLIDVLSDITTEEAESEYLPFISKSSESIVNSAVQGLRLNNDGFITKDSNNILQLQNIVTTAILNTELSQIGEDNILSNAIKSRHISSGAIVNNHISGLIDFNKLSGVVPTTRKINEKSLNGDIILTASDIGAATTNSTVANSNAVGNVDKSNICRFGQNSVSTKGNCRITRVSDNLAFLSAVWGTESFQSGTTWEESGVTISFPFSFRITPQVVVSVKASTGVGGAHRQSYPTGVSTTGFTLNYETQSSSGNFIPGTVSVSWIAIGM